GVLYALRRVALAHDTASLRIVGPLQPWPKRRRVRRTARECLSRRLSVHAPAQRDGHTRDLAPARHASEWPSHRRPARHPTRRRARHPAACRGTRRGVAVGGANPDVARVALIEHRASIALGAMKIAENEVTWTAVRAQGAGGQNVNKVSSA